MIEQHLLALLVLVPLLAAPLSLLGSGSSRWSWWVATLATMATAMLALRAAVTVVSSGPVEYAMGGWAPPWGIAYRMDALNAFVALLIALVGVMVMPFARGSVGAEVHHARLPGFYAAYLLALTGMLGITVTGDVFNLFVFLEISSLASYTLISLANRRPALVAAYDYLIVGTIGATFILIGIGLAYAITGTLNMADLAARLEALPESRAAKTAFAFFAIGAGIKLAMFPLHVWLPNAYAQAPSAVSAFLAATSTKVAFYVLVRLAITVFGVEFVFGRTPFGTVLLLAALLAIVWASLRAIAQDNVKRLLAYSSIAQIGYMVLGLSMATAMGLMAGVLHLFNHALMKAALFLAAGCVYYRLGTVSIKAMAGLGRDMPWTMAAFALAGLSLIGVPPTVGFVSKWYLVLAALERGWWPIAAFIVATSLLAVAYIWKVVEAAWLTPAAKEREALREAPLAMLLPTWLLVIACFYFGLDTQLTAGMAKLAAGGLIGGGQ